jgi:ATP-dependent helicase HrpA
MKLFRRQEDAIRAAGPAIRRLAETALASDVKWMRKEIGATTRQLAAPEKKPANVQNSLQQLSLAKGTADQPFITPEILQETGAECVLAQAFAPVFPLTSARFAQLLETARRELPALARQVADWAKRILTLRATILESRSRYPGLEEDVRRLVPREFLAKVPYARLPHLHRYLRAVQMRAERAALTPAKDAEKARQLAPFSDWATRVSPENQEKFRWLLEEFRVSIFAQELGTAEPASAQRLRALGSFQA